MARTASDLEGTVICVYPAPKDGGEYTQRLAVLWSALGGRVVGYRELPRTWRTGRARRVVVLNWFEDWAISGRLPPALALAKAVAMLTWFQLTCGKLVWVRHNFRAQNPRGNRWHRKLLIRWLEWLADDVVTHRPVAGLRSTVVPHSMMGRVPFEDRPRAVDHLWLGTVKRYKGLEHLLRAWPVGVPLRIVGYAADAALADEIQTVIADRGLAVTWTNRFVEDDELNRELMAAKTVIVSNLDESMIVSGVFFHAASMGANVLIRDSDFGRAMADTYAFASTYATESLADDLLAGGRQTPAQVRAEIQRRNGDEVVSAAWSAILAGPRARSLSRVAAQ